MLSGENEEIVCAAVDIIPRVSLRETSSAIYRKIVAIEYYNASVINKKDSAFAHINGDEIRRMEFG